VLELASKNERQKKRRVHSVVASIFVCGSLLLTACSGTAVALPSPEIKIYLLDLTHSGDISNQFRLIEPDLIKDMTTRSLGSPDVNEGPSLTKFYFVGTNSRALREFSLQDQQAAYELYKYIDDENNNTRTGKFWRLLTEKYQNYMIEYIESGVIPTKETCTQNFNDVLLQTFSSEAVREVYSTFMCRMAIYSLSTYKEMQLYIAEKSVKGEQKGSDVFGALSKINSQIQKFKKEYPKSKVSLTLATDGDHNLGGNSSTNLRLNIKDNADLCSLAEKYRNEFQLNEFIDSDFLNIDPRGIAALKTGTGDYPRQLEEFWNCFFPK
jgi:hypothetical protein